MNDAVLNAFMDVSIIVYSVTLFCQLSWEILRDMEVCDINYLNK